MATKPTFSTEVANLLHAAEGNPLETCIQCGTCSGSCPVAKYMDQTPRRIIAMVNAGMKDEVLKTNTFWYCASCYQCTVRCPSGIDIAEAMYALKRYTMWKNQYKEGLIGPTFSETFVKTIARSEALNATNLMLKGRIPILPPRIKRLEKFRRMIAHIIPIGGIE